MRRTANRATPSREAQQIAANMTQQRMIQLIAILKRGQSFQIIKTISELSIVTLPHPSKWVAVFADNGGIPPCIEILKRGTDTARKLMCGLMNNLSCRGENHPLMGKEGVFNSFAELFVSDENYELRGAILGALSNIVQDEGTRVLFMDAGIIEFLAQQHKILTNTQLLVDVSSVYGNLAYSAEARARIGKQGGIPPTLKLLFSDRLFISHAVWQLSRDNKDNQAIIVREGGIKSMIKLVSVEPTENNVLSRQFVAATLDNLAEEEEFGNLIIAEGGLKPLIDLLRNGDSIGKRNAASALLRLATSEENKKIIVNEGGIQALMGVFLYEKKEPRITAAKAIQRITEKENGEKILEDKETVEKIISYARDKKGEARSIALSILQQIADSNIAESDTKQVVTEFVKSKLKACAVCGKTKANHVPGA